MIATQKNDMLHILQKDVQLTSRALFISFSFAQKSVHFFVFLPLLFVTPFMHLLSELKLSSQKNFKLLDITYTCRCRNFQSILCCIEV